MKEGGRLTEIADEHKLYAISEAQWTTKTKQSQTNKIKTDRPTGLRNIRVQNKKQNKQTNKKAR